MQESIYRMSGQVQAMQQEVRELAQLAQQLYQQHSNHFQQLQGQATQNSTMYQLAGNEQSSAQLLKHLTDVCTEMNSHLRTISQQMGSNTSAGMSIRTNQGQQKQAAAGPIATDTTHFNHAAVPGMDQRMTSQISDAGTNQLNSATGTGLASFSDTSTSIGMSTSTKGAQMTSGMGQSSQMNYGSPMQASSMSSMGQQSAQQQSSQMNYGSPMQASSMSVGQGAQQQRRQSLGTQMTGGTTMGSVTSGNTMSASNMGSMSAMGGQSTQNKTNAGAAMSTQQSSTSAAELQDNANEYREEPHYTKYPYNRQTT